jgi:ATPase subunit of ABC transporter with duplicated ATPase domains
VRQVAAVILAAGEAKRFRRSPEILVRSFCATCRNGRARVGTGMSSVVPASNVPLTVEDLCKTYGKTVAVGPLSFSLTLGSTTGMLGGNGAGKTTTIGMIMATTNGLRPNAHSAGVGDTVNEAFRK